MSNLLLPRAAGRAAGAGHLSLLLTAQPSPAQPSPSAQASQQERMATTCSLEFKVQQSMQVGGKDAAAAAPAGGTQVGPSG